MTFAISKVALALALAPLAYGQATTWVVDDSGGAGVNFTDIGAAIAAASPGDRVLVRDGTYAAFTLDKGLFVLGTGLVQTGNVTVAGVPQGSVAALANLRTRQISVTACGGPVLFDSILATTTPSAIINSAQYHLAVVTASLDVRFQRCELIAPAMGLANWSGAAGLVVSGSRVELSSSRVQGGNGGKVPGSGCWEGNFGGHGLSVQNFGRVHAARSSALGGNGSNGTNLCGMEGGDGGHGARIDATSSCVIAGISTDSFRGGLAGAPDLGQGLLSDGSGVYVAFGGELRHSGVTIVAGDPSSPDISGAATLAVPADPTLEFLGVPQAGNAVQFVTHAQPGFVLRLQQGHVPLVVDDEVVEIERLNNRIRIHPLGLIPNTGSLALDLTVPAFAPPGWLRIFQGYEIDGAANALVQRTNSAFTLVR
ncbi:MAG: hypothetical protein HUU28_02490 [Planctomycetaceae bacterium]|nr:hypothetical protein [Planctomycetaceae bacterium]